MTSNSTTTSATQLRRSYSVGAAAANAVNCGAGRLRSIDVTVCRSLTAPSLSTTPTETTPTREATVAEKEAEERREMLEDIKIVAREVQRYEDDGLEKFDGKMTDMVSYWNVRSLHWV